MQKIKTITDSELKEKSVWLWSFVPNLLEKLDRVGLSVIRTSDLIAVNQKLSELEDDLK